MKTIEQVYAGFYELSLNELRQHLIGISQLGVVDAVEREVWAVKEFEWDLVHIDLAIDRLDEVFDERRTK